MTPDCARVMDALGSPLPPDLASHAAGCEDCRALLEGFGSLEAPVAPPVAAPPSPGPRTGEAGLEATRRLALAELAAHPRPTPWWHELLVLLAVDAVVLGAGLLAMGRKGMVLNMAPPWVVVAMALLILALVGGGALLSLAPLRRPWPWALVAMGAVGVGVAQVLFGSGVEARPYVSGMMRCMGSEVLLSIVPLAATLVLLCRSAFQPVRTLAAGLSSAGVSLLVLHLHCPDGTVSHLLWGHVVPWMLLAGTAVLVRSRLRTRSYAP